MNHNSLALFSLGFLIADAKYERDRKKARKKDEEYQRDPSTNPGEFFKRNGWLTFENLNEVYGKGKTAETIRKDYAGYLRLKAMKPEERAEHVNNPELLTGLNEMSFIALKKRRDEHITNLVFFQKNKEAIARSYGMVIDSQGSVSVDDAGAKFLGIIFIFLFLMTAMFVAAGLK